MVKSYEQTIWVCYDCAKHHNTRMDGDLCCIPQPEVIGCEKILDSGVDRDDDGKIIEEWLIRCENGGRLCEDCKKLDDAKPCGSCGHRKDWHFESRRTGYGCNMPNCDCDCKLFVVEKESEE